MTDRFDLDAVRARCDAATDIPGFPGYQATRDGRIISTKSNWRGYGARVIREVLNAYGYPSVRLTVGNRRIHKSVHSLMALTFFGHRTGLQVRHLDGDKRNNRIQNLRWGTAAENATDRDLHGMTASGERNGWSKLTDSDVVMIRQMCAEGASQRVIARRFGVSQRTIFRVVNGEGWSHVAA